MESFWKQCWENNENILKKQVIFCEKQSMIEEEKTDAGISPEHAGKGLMFRAFKREKDGIEKRIT